MFRSELSGCVELVPEVPAGIPDHAPSGELSSKSVPQIRVGEASEPCSTKSWSPPLAIDQKLPPVPTWVAFTVPLETPLI